MDRAAWIESRRSFLGASEVAAVCGLDPFKSALDVWAVKKGLIADESSIAADMGNIFEGPLLQYYANRHGRTLKRPGTLKRADFPWMAATPDGIADGVRNVQVKLVGEDMTWHWRDGVPEYVQLQVQWEMWITGLRISDVVVCLGGTKYEEPEVQRDDAVIGHVVEICSRFWRDNVELDQMPDVDGSERARAVLAARFPRPTAGMKDAVPEFVQMALRYKEITQAIGAVEDEKETIGNAMRLAIGEGLGFKWADGYVSWKPDKTGARRLYVHTKGV